MTNADVEESFRVSRRTTPHAILFYCHGYRFRHHITDWLRRHKYNYHVGGGMVFVHLPHPFKQTKRFFELLSYAETQRLVRVRVYLLDDTLGTPVFDYFHTPKFYMAEKKNRM